MTTHIFKKHMQIAESHLMTLMVLIITIDSHTFLQVIKLNKISKFGSCLLLIRTNSCPQPTGCDSVVELSAIWNVDMPTWKYPRSLESLRVSSTGIDNDFEMTVM
ncbi:hypothetical protein TNCV_2144331 [Trichonephila clavipes]|nr:hypothetical protein TNCV_2144331 [Trichonephila clavipes]